MRHYHALVFCLAMNAMHGQALNPQIHAPLLSQYEIGRAPFDGGPTGGHKVYAGDFDGDGDQDVLHFDVKDHTSTASIALLVNNGQNQRFKPSFTRRVINANEHLRDAVIVDLDKDGDLDIVGATHPNERPESSLSPFLEQRLVWFNNNGAGQFTRTVISDELGGRKPAVIDANADGRWDIVNIYGKDLYLWTQAEDGSFSSEVIATLSRDANSIEVADFNGDDAADLLVTGEALIRVLTRNTADTESISYTEQAIVTQANCGGRNLEFFDSCVVYESLQIVATDIDGDGDTDIGVTNTSGFTAGLSWLENKGNLAFDFHTFAAESGEMVYDARWQDIDNDGDIDLLFTYSDRTQPWITNEAPYGWYENRAGAGNAPQYVRHAIQSDKSFGRYSGTTVDINGDGIRDFVSALSSTVYVADTATTLQQAKGFHRFGVDDGDGLSIVNDSEDDVTLSVNVQEGLLRINDVDNLAAVVTYDEGDKTGAKTVQAVGDQPAIQAVLDQLVYVATPGFFGMDTLTLEAGDDQHKQRVHVRGTGVVLEAPASFTGLSPIALTINLTTPVSGLSASDFIVSGGAVALDANPVANDDGYQYTASITPLTNADILIELPAAAASNANGGQTVAANLLICGDCDDSDDGSDGNDADDGDSGDDGDTTPTPPVIPSLPDSSSAAPVITLAPSKTARATGATNLYVSGQYSHRAYLNDIDDDGDLDMVSAIFSGVYQGGLQIQENLGSNEVDHPSFQRHEIMRDSNVHDFLIVDIDSDGDKDIIASTLRDPNVFASEEHDRVYWFENTGDLAFTAHQLDAEHGGLNVSVMDMNDDDALDILVASRDGVRVLEQIDDEGTISFSEPTLLDGGLAAPPQVLATGDLDGDNDWDILVIQAREVGVYEATDDGFTWRSVATFYTAGAVDGYLHDMNGDDRLDIVFAAEGLSSTSLQWGKNLGDLDFDLQPIAERGISDLSNLRVQDVDQDGDPDVLYSSLLQTSETLWMENSGGESPSFIAHKLSSSSYDTVDAGDINGDGTIDYLMDFDWFNGAMDSQRADQIKPMGSAQAGFGFRIEDTDSDVLEVELSVNQGSLNITHRDKFIFLEGDGLNDARIRLRGYLADINSMLDSLTYIMDPSFKGQAALTLSVNDGGHQMADTLVMNVFGLDLTITGPDGFTPGEAVNVDFTFSSDVSGFMVSDIAVSGAATSVVDDSFSTQASDHYRVQVLPESSNDLIVKVAAAAAQNVEQAESSATFAIFCAAGGDCSVPTGSSDKDDLYPQAGAPESDDDSDDDSGDGEDTDDTDTGDTDDSDTETDDTDTGNNPDSTEDGNTDQTGNGGDDSSDDNGADSDPNTDNSGSDQTPTEVDTGAVSNSSGGGSMPLALVILLIAVQRLRRIR